MRKLVAVAAFAAVMMVGLAASAASVNIFIRQTSATEWTVGATSETDNNGGIALQMSGIASRTLSALPQISAADSPFVGDALGATFQVNNPNSTTTLIPAGQPELVLATLTGSGPFVFNNGDDAFGYTAVSMDLTTVLDFSLTVVPTPPVPEPTTMVLFGLGLAALAVVRRSA